MLLLVVAGAMTPVSAQTIYDERTWWNITTQERARTESPWRWYVEVQGRMRDGVDALDQLLVRPAMGYDLTSRSSVWFGYGYTPGFPASDGGRCGLKRHTMMRAVVVGSVWFVAIGCG